MRSIRLPTAVVVLGALAGACAHNRPLGPVERCDSGLSMGLHASDLGTQSLFRVRYQGVAGSGALRLVLRLGTADHYLVETKDRFGRGVWRIAVGPSGTVLVDDRERVFCKSDGDIRIPEVALESLPLSGLPAILLGRLPGGLEPGVRAGEYRDRAGRRWTVTAAGSVPSKWTLWEGGEPWLWWRRGTGGGGILSHRAGTQLRWKRVAGEPMPGEFPQLVVAPEYVRIACDAWPSGLEDSSPGH